MKVEHRSGHAYLAAEAGERENGGRRRREASGVSREVWTDSQRTFELIEERKKGRHNYDVVPFLHKMTKIPLKYY